MPPIKLLHKPKEPKRLGTKKRRLKLESCDKLSDVLVAIGNTDPSLVTFHMHGNMYGDMSSCMFSWDQIETDEQFAARVDVYNHELKEYEHWCVNNKESIAEEKKLRRDRRKELKRISIDNDRKRLEEEIALLDIKQRKLQQHKKDLK